MSRRTSRNRKKARKLAHNNREYILYSRMMRGDCIWCPRHDKENLSGSHSRWGKKEASKRKYFDGKGANNKKWKERNTWLMDLKDKL